MLETFSTWIKAHMDKYDHTLLQIFHGPEGIANDLTGIRMRSVS
jgi:hypothetical protein